MDLGFPSGSLENRQKGAPLCRPSLPRCRLSEMGSGAFIAQLDENPERTEQCEAYIRHLPEPVSGYHTKGYVGFPQSRPPDSESCSFERDSTNWCSLPSNFECCVKPPYMACVFLPFFPPQWTIPLDYPQPAKSVTKILK